MGPNEQDVSIKICHFNKQWKNWSYHAEQYVLCYKFLGDFKEHEKINLDWGIDFQLHCIGSLLHVIESSLADNIYDILPDDFSNFKLSVFGNIKLKIKMN